MVGQEASSGLKFHAEAGFFVDFVGLTRQDSAFRVTTLPELGLIDQQYDEDEDDDADQADSTTTGGGGGDASFPRKPWTRFRDHVHALNARDPARTTYKILYITRHGFGYHNYYEAKVGTEAWDNHWSRLEGDGEIVWADSRLNAEGIAQATALGQFWVDAVRRDGLPLPGTVYTSPLARCLETTRLAFGPVFEEKGVPFRPVVKELLRETVIDHTCDRRSPRSWIEANYPSYAIEPGFSEEDVRWGSRRWETFEDHVARKQKVLEEIFATDENEVVALTVHSGATSAILAVVGSPEFLLREGTSIALLVRADRVA